MFVHVCSHATQTGKYFDGQVPILKVDKTGAKRWVQWIMIKGKRTVIGLVSASLVSLAEARETALDNRKVAAPGRVEAHCRSEVRLRQF